jgi:hypothetical protein
LAGLPDKTTEEPQPILQMKDDPVARWFDIDRTFAKRRLGRSAR